MATQGAAPQSSPSSARRIKLSAVLDPTLDAEVIPISSEVLKDMHKRDKKAMGAEPKTEVEPTDDQVSALSQVLDAGYAPYADFSVFGRYGKRMQHKMQFVAFQSLPDGTW